MHTRTKLIGFEKWWKSVKEKNVRHTVIKSVLFSKASATYLRDVQGKGGHILKERACDGQTLLQENYGTKVGMASDSRVNQYAASFVACHRSSITFQKFTGTDYHHTSLEHAPYFTTPSCTYIWWSPLVGVVVQLNLV